MPKPPTEQSNIDEKLVLGCGMLVVFGGCIVAAIMALGIVIFGE